MMFKSTLLPLAGLATIATSAPAANASPINLEIFFASKQCEFTSSQTTLNTTPGCHQWAGVVESFIVETLAPQYQLIAYANQDCTGASETYHLDFDGCNSFDPADFAQSYCIPQLGGCP